VKYLCLVYADEGRLGAVPDDHCVAYDAKLRDSGRCLASQRAAQRPRHAGKAGRVMQAMLQMSKIDVDGLRRAAKGRETP